MTSGNVNKHYDDKYWIDGLGPNHKNHSQRYLDQLQIDLEQFKNLPQTPQSTILLKNQLQRIADKLVRRQYPW